MKTPTKAPAPIQLTVTDAHKLRAELSATRAAAAGLANELAQAYAAIEHFNAELAALKATAASGKN